jgi:hypothetical protein
MENLCLHNDVVSTQEGFNVCRICGLVLGPALPEYSYSSLGFKEKENYCIEQEPAINRSLVPKGKSTFKRPVTVLPLPHCSEDDEEDDESSSPLFGSKRYMRDMGVTKKILFLRKHKRRVRTGPSAYKKHRIGTKRYSKDYISKVPEAYLATIGELEYKLSNVLPQPEYLKEFHLVDDLRKECIQIGKRKVENLLQKFAEFEQRGKTGKEEEEKEGGSAAIDWRLMYKLDIKVYAAVAVLYMEDPPDSAKGYCEMVSIDHKRSVDFLLDDMQKKKAIVSITAPNRLAKLLCQMWKVYYIMHHVNDA